MKSIIRKIAVILFVLTATISTGILAAKPVYADDDNDCTTILDNSWCNEKDGGGITEIIKFGANILMWGLGLAATIGIVVCGVMIITARDDPAQVQKARKRMIEIAIGLVAWVLIEVLIQFIIPGGSMSMF